MREHKEIEINSTVVQAKEMWESFEIWRCKYCNIEGIDKINHSELLKIYISLNAKANKHTELEQCLQHMNWKSSLTAEFL